MLETVGRENRERIEALEDLIQGGGDVEYTRSVRGRLHTIEGTIAGFVLRRSVQGTFAARWVQATFVLCAVATAAAAWYAAVAN